MKPSEIRKKDRKELVKIAEELKEELFRLKLKAVTGELTHNANIKKARRNLARVYTILNETGERS